MNETNNKQKVVTLLVDINKRNKKDKLFEYPELNYLFEDGMYIESFNQCRLSNKKLFITFILRYYHSV